MSYYSPSTKGWNSQYNRSGSNTSSPGFDRTNTARDLSQEEDDGIEKLYMQRPPLNTPGDIEEDDNDNNEDEQGDDNEGEESDDNDNNEDEQGDDDNDNEDESTLGSLRKAQNQARQNQEVDVKNKVAEAVVEKSFKLGTYTLYSLAWKFMYELFCLPILYLWVHFFMRYMCSSKNFCAFVDPGSPESIKEIILKDKDETSTGSMLGCILLSFVILAILALLAILIYIIIKYQTMAWDDKVKLVPGMAVKLIKGGPDEAFAYFLEKLLK